MVIIPIDLAIIKNDEDKNKMKVLHRSWTCSFNKSLKALLKYLSLPILYSKARLKPPLTPLTDGTDAQWPPTVGLPLSVSTWELVREVEASPDSGRALVKGQEESNFPSLRTG